MKSEKIQFNTCSFTAPKGYTVLEAAAVPDPFISSPGHNNGVPAGYHCITLVREALNAKVLDFFQTSREMRPAADPSAISLTTLQSRSCPFLYLKRTDEVLQTYFQGFSADFYKKEQIGKYQGAISQNAFDKTFQVFRLNMAWIMENTMAILTMTTPASSLTKSWTILKAFAGSFEITR